MPLVQFEEYMREIRSINDINSPTKNHGNQILKSIAAIRNISDHPYLENSQILNFTSKELIATSAKLQTAIEILKNIEK